MANEQIDPMVLRLVDRKGDVALVLRNASPPTKIRVSSRALISASPFFRAMLNGHYAEGKQLIETGRAEIELEDEDDPEAMVMVLKAIHSRHTPRFEQIPRTLMRVIIILDKFMIPREKFERQLLACVETLQPPTDSDEMTCLVCIVWMLGYPSVFAMLARAIVVAGVKLDFTGLPVPGQVADSLNDFGRQLLGNIAHELQLSLDGFSPRTQKSPCCERTQRDLQEFLLRVKYNDEMGLSHLIARIRTVTECTFQPRTPRCSGRIQLCSSVRLRAFEYVQGLNLDTFDLWLKLHGQEIYTQTGHDAEGSIFHWATHMVEAMLDLANP